MEYICEKYIEFLFPGSLFYEAELRKIDTRNILIIKAPKGSFGFVFFDIIKVNIIHEETEVSLSSGRINESQIHYYGGKLYSIEEMKEHFPEQKKLIKDAVHDGWKGVVRCRSGMWYSFLENDIFIPLKE